MAVDLSRDPHRPHHSGGRFREDHADAGLRPVFGGFWHGYARKVLAQFESHPDLHLIRIDPTTGANVSPRLGLWRSW